MKKLIDYFIETLMKIINGSYTCYYEEAPTNATYPYLVMPTLNVSDLSYGDLAMFDLEIYTHELSKISVEKIMDTLKDNLHGFSYCDPNIGFHLGVENRLLVKSNEQDLAIRRVTLSARIFK